MMNNQQGYQMYQGIEDMLSMSTGATVATASCVVDLSPSHSLLYNVSALREKIEQLESYVGIIISPSRMQQDSVGVAVSGAGSLAQEIIVAGSSIMYALQKIRLKAVPHPTDELLAGHAKASYEDSSEVLDHVVLSNNLDGGPSIIFGNADVHYSCNPSNTTSDHVTSGNNGDHAVNSSKTHGKPENSSTAEKKKEPKLGSSSKEYDVIELDEAELLARYTHYCQVCGKGFKRDANLRMHMRAHGEEYKTTAALTNPARTTTAALSGDKEGGACGSVARKYSCPQERCRWNKKHPQFAPLKSLVCMKNHYRRSHCPKMHVCKRCGQKKFSLLSDLRTHEKHCGDLRWRCSCGTNFSRKDKLMGHVALFVGHTPITGGASCSFTKN